MAEFVNFLESMYAFWAFCIAVITAQAAKPFFMYIRKREWQPRIVFESGGFPSSHTAGVVSLSLSIGLREGFDSTLFAIVLAFSIIVAYDAANVRYYAGQNIQMTQQLIKDFQELTEYELDDPIYLTKVKEVLGHKWIEVIGGSVHGIAVAWLLFLV